MNWLFLGLALSVLITFILTYMIYLYFHQPIAVLANNVDLSKHNQAIAVTNNPSARTFAIGTWIYINSWNSSSSKTPLLMMNGLGAVPLTPLFKLLIGQTAPSLHLDLNTTNPTKDTTIQIFDSVPMQRWVYVVISVSTNYVDIYWNGQLNQSVKLHGSMIVAPNVNTTLNIQPGADSTSSLTSDIQLAQVTRWSTAVSPSEVVTQFSKGNGQSWIPSLSIGITQYNVPMASFRLS